MPLSCSCVSALFPFFCSLPVFHAFVHSVHFNSPSVVSKCVNANTSRLMFQSPPLGFALERPALLFRSMLASGHRIRSRSERVLAHCSVACLSSLFIIRCCRTRSQLPCPQRWRPWHYCKPRAKRENTQITNVRSIKPANITTAMCGAEEVELAAVAVLRTLVVPQLKTTVQPATHA